MMRWLILWAPRRANLLKRYLKGKDSLNRLAAIFARETFLVTFAFCTPTTLYITKTRLFKYIEFFQPKKENFQNKKKSDILHIPAQNIDCWYSLEPPR